MFVLEVRNLRYAYPDGTPALEGVNLALEPGEKTALVGANGSGKSTLLLHLTGCLGPDSGEILLDGRPLGDDVDRARRMVGMMFQEPDDQLFMPSVLEDVAFAPRASGTPPARPPKKRRRCSNASESPIWLPGRRTASRGERSAWSPSPEYSSPTPKCWCWTNRRRLSTRAPAG